MVSTARQLTDEGGLFGEESARRYLLTRGEDIELFGGEKRIEGMTLKQLLAAVKEHGTAEDIRLLDLFCGAGGAAVGYHNAGFDEIIGVDIKPQPRYPFEFVQADALEYLAEHGREFDAIHASPPCQGYSIMHNLPWLRGRDYPLLILPTIEMLEALGKPYVVENVMGGVEDAPEARA